MRILHDASSAEEVLRRIERLRPDSPRLWGRMSVDQMLWHLNAGLLAALGELRMAPRDNVFTRTVLKWLGLRGPWPKGRMPTDPEIVASGSYDFGVERERLLRLIDEFRARDVDEGWPRSPLFGPLSGREWSRLELRHIDHHLRQFGA